MIANCGQLGLDWERVSLSAYLEAQEAHNEAYGGGEKAAPSPERAAMLAQVMAARSVH